MNMNKCKIIIYCDGGLGNRLNTLISGMTLVRYFDIDYVIHWPINQWCSANYNDIFTNENNISNLSLKNLKNNLDNYVFLLHDNIASNVLDVPFSSAYNYFSIYDFYEKTIKLNYNIFYYPAIFPNWIPFEYIHKEFQNIIFTDYITSEVNYFLTSVIKKPFYGIHLRRTDLNIGLTDFEVFKLVKENNKLTFFVCSDDPQAERLATGHPNVFSRTKSAYVQKREEKYDWLAITEDEDERIYHGNIKRDKESIIEGAIDMLILAHSQIIGFSGSTFQNMAKYLGEHWSKLEWSKPQPLEVYSYIEIEKKIEMGQLSVDNIIKIANNWYSDRSNIIPLNIITKSLNYLQGNDYLQLLYALAQITYNNENYKLANIYLNEIILCSPNLADPINMQKRVLEKLKNFQK